jgi:hypothetical protein
MSLILIQYYVTTTRGGLKVELHEFLTAVLKEEK